MSNDTHNTFCVTTKEQLDDAVKDVILGIFEEGGDGDAAILVPPEYMYITQLVIDTHLPNWEKKLSEEMITKKSMTAFTVKSGKTVTGLEGIEPWSDTCKKCGHKATTFRKPTPPPVKPPPIK